jgi:hypothetical protein
VLDDLGWERAAVLGLGGAATLLFAASHPDRTKALVLHNVSARLRPADGYPYGLPAEEVERFSVILRRWYGSGRGLRVSAPSAANDGRLERWLARCERLMCTPDEFETRLRLSYDMDLRHALPLIQAPTLVLYRTDVEMAEQARYVADHIEGAVSRQLPGRDFMFFVGDTGPMIDAIETFLTGELRTRDVDRVLATVLFTDLVGSTALAARLGDRRWRELLGTHDALVGAELARFRGREIKGTGDGVLAVFDGPGRAPTQGCSRHLAAVFGGDLKPSGSAGCGRCGGLPKYAPVQPQPLGNHEPAFPLGCVGGSEDRQPAIPSC